MLKRRRKKKKKMFDKSEKFLELVYRLKEKFGMTVWEQLKKDSFVYWLGTEEDKRKWNKEQ